MEIGKVVIKLKKQVAETVGEGLAKELLQRRRSTWRKLPCSIRFHDTKPQFYLGEGNILDAFGYDLGAELVTGEHYCGCGDTAINHREELLSEGQRVPDNMALIFTKLWWNGRNMSWDVYIVSSNVRPQLDVKAS